MDDKTLWLATAFVLMFEGFMPMVAPNFWRQAFERLVKMPDNAIRAFGAISAAAGVLLYWFLQKT